MVVINAFNVFGVMLGEKNHVLAIEHIGYSFFSIRTLEFQPVSVTHELNVLLFQIPFEPTPIVAGLSIVRLFINIPHHIRSRKPPAVVLVIPDRPPLLVIKNTYRLLTHNSTIFGLD